MLESKKEADKQKQPSKNEVILILFVHLFMVEIWMLFRSIQLENIYKKLHWYCAKI